MVLVINIMNDTVESTVDFAEGNEFPFHQGASAKAVPIFYMRLVGPPSLNRNDRRHPRPAVQDGLANALSSMALVTNSSR